jgi:hypothetical protein
MNKCQELSRRVGGHNLSVGNVPWEVASTRIIIYTRQEGSKKKEHG